MRTNPEALKALRLRTGYTITQLSNKSGVDRTVLTRLESGERRGTPEQIKALAEALEVPMLVIAVQESAA